MSEKVNTSKDLKNNTGISLAQMDAERKKAAQVLGKQKQVEVLIPAYLENRLGKTVPVGINGAVIHVEVGKKSKIPESMAKVLNESLANLKL